MVGGVSSHDPVSVIHVESRSIRYTTNPNVPSSSRAEAALRHVSPARQQARPPVRVGLAAAQSAPGQSRGWGDPSEAAPLCISETPVGSQGRHGTPTQDRIPGRRWLAPPCLCSLGAVPSAPRRPLHVGEGLSSHLWAAGGGPDASCGTGAAVPATNMLPPGPRAGCLHARTAAPCF